MDDSSDIPEDDLLEKYPEKRSSTSQKIPMTNTKSEVLRTLSVLHPEHDVVEVRTKWESGTVMLGRTKSHEAIAKWAEDCGGEPNIFATINKLPNMFEPPLNTVAADGVKNEFVMAIRWLVVDVDSIRADSSQPGTGEEIREATARAKRAMQFLYAYGFPQPVVAFSGNGWHLLYKTTLENSAETTWLMRDMTKILHGRFKTDPQSHGAGQVLRLYGARNPKGGRQTKIEYVPEPLLGAKKESLVAMVGSYKAPLKKAGNRAGFSGDKVDQFLLEHCGLDAQRVDGQEQTKWVMSECPLCGYEKPGVAVMGRFPNGALWFKCLHDPTCEGKGWKEFRAAMEEKFGKFDFTEGDEQDSEIEVEAE